MTSRSHQHRRHPPSRSWTPASPAPSRPPQPPSCSGQGKTAVREHSQGLEEGARPDTPTRAHTPAVQVRSCPLPSPSTLARPQATGGGACPEGAGRGGAGLPPRAGRAGGGGGRTGGGTLGQRRPERARRVGPELGRGSSPVLGSSVVPTPPYPTPSHSQARGAISPVSTSRWLPPAPSSMRKLSRLESVAVPAPLLGPNLCSCLCWSLLTPSSIRTSLSLRPITASRCPSPLSPSFLPLSRPPPPSVVLPLLSSLALLRSRAGARPQAAGRRPGVRPGWASA